MSGRPGRSYGAAHRGSVTRHDRVTGGGPVMHHAAVRTVRVSGWARLASWVRHRPARTVGVPRACSVCGFRCEPGRDVETAGVWWHERCRARVAGEHRPVPAQRAVCPLCGHHVDAPARVHAGCQARVNRRALASETAARVDGTEWCT